MFITRFVPRPMVLAALLACNAVGVAAAQDRNKKHVDLNGIWKLGSNLVRFQHVGDAVTARFLKERTNSLSTGMTVEKGSANSSSTSDSMKGKLNDGKLTGQFNLYYYGENLPNGVQPGWQFQDATFDVSDDQQAIEFSTPDKSETTPGGLVKGRYLRVGYLPPCEYLPGDQVRGAVLAFRAALEELVRKQYAHMQGRLILECFREFGGCRHYVRVYEHGVIRMVGGVRWNCRTRLVCGYDDQFRRFLILIPIVERGEQPKDLPQPPKPRPQLKLPRLELPQQCMVVTNRDRLRAAHGENYEEVRRFLESFGPVIDLAQHAQDPGDWQAVDAAIEEHFDRAKYGCLFIFGDGDIVPFGEYDNPLHGRRMDPDRVIHSDDPYADFDHDPHNTWDVMLARLPNDPAVLQAAARRLAAPDDGRRAANGFAVYGNARWPLSGPLAELGNPADPRLRLSAPGTEKDLPRDFFAGHHVILNLHGSDADGSHYWGESDTEFVTAMNVGQAEAPGAVVLAACCYGASTTGKNADDSIALRFLAGGAEAYIGSTKVGYIGPTTETSFGLWGRLMAEDIRDGTPPLDAFLQAKRVYARSVGELGPTQFKQLHQMVYLGVPPLRSKQPAQ